MVSLRRSGHWPFMSLMMKDRWSVWGWVDTDRSCRICSVRLIFCSQVSFSSTISFSVNSSLSIASSLDSIDSDDVLGRLETSHDDESPAVKQCNWYTTLSYSRYSQRAGQLRDELYKLYNISNKFVKIFKHKNDRRQKCRCDKSLYQPTSVLSHGSFILWNKFENIYSLYQDLQLSYWKVANVDKTRQEKIQFSTQ